MARGAGLTAAPPPRAPSQWGGGPERRTARKRGARGCAGGSFGCARGTREGAGRRAGRAARPPRLAGQPGGCPPAQHGGSEKSPEEWRACAGPSINHPLRVRPEADLRSRIRKAPGASILTERKSSGNGEKREVEGRQAKN